MSDADLFRALAGGALIGASGLILWLAIGRVAGVSGILAGLFDSSPDPEGWRLSFALGLVVGGLLSSPSLGASAGAGQLESASSMLLTVAAGLLVGFGSRLGGGCTSGHGVCGVATGSRRSSAATLVFLGTGMAVATFADLAAR